jgi:hypothetical protein
MAGFRNKVPRRTAAEKREIRARTALVAQKQIRALELRSAGHTYQAIADKLGYATAQGAKYSVYAALREMRTEPAKAVRRLHLVRLEQLLKAVWDKAIAGDIPASEHALNILDRICLMHGIDVKAPLKVAVVPVQPEQPILSPEERRLRIVEIIQQAHARIGLPAPNGNTPDPPPDAA